MLKARIFTAVLLISAFFLALFLLPPLGWSIFATGIATVAAWEWGGLMRYDSKARIKLAAAFVLICAAIVALQPAALGVESGFPSAAGRLGRWFYLPAALFWLLVVPWWLTRRLPLPRSACGMAIGAVLIFPTWLAFIQLRQVGAPTLVAALAVVWVADTAAYVFGRTFGRHKMAPAISPGKTWEGALGSCAAVIVYGLALSSELPPAFSSNYALLVPALALITAISILGDLFESLLKRQAGLKDSSNILPGHGGVLDRIDSLTSTLPLVALVWLTVLY